MLLSRGDRLIFVTRPINLAFVIATILTVILMVAPAVRKRRSDLTD
jgi:TctA family transporter